MMLVELARTADENGSGSALKEDAQEIRRAVEQATALTRQLLTFSHKESLQPELVDMNEIVGSAIRMLRRLIREDIEISTGYDPTIGRVRVDPGQIEQAIVNLVINACDAMPEGGRLRIETSVVAAPPGAAAENDDQGPLRHVRVKVSDTGIGMDAETRTRAFDPFFSTKGPDKGTGLGLATVYGVVTQCGGQIDLDSELGRGTTFEILLPETADLPDQRQAERQREVDGGSETILLVEDNEGVRTLTERLLTGYGYAVIAVARPNDAVALVRDGRADAEVLLTDIVMPEMNGPQLADSIRRHKPGLPVVVMSGYAGAELERTGRLPDDVLILQKPFAPSQLASTIRTAIDCRPETSASQELDAA
jgi:CheY-like chemotaxis protein